MKAAVIGVGRMGRRHVQVVQEAGLELVGVCDANAEALAVTRADRGVTEAICFESAGLMLKETAPECVVISTTAPSHAELTEAAVQAGARYILCEKPMATSLSECDRMLEVCRSRGVKLAINHQMRFMEQYTEPKQIIESESFGGLSSIVVVAGNFGIAMNGSHYFEMFRYMTGEVPFEVTAWFADEVVPNPRGPQYEDRGGQVRLTTRSGRRFYMDAGTDQGHGMRTVYAGPRGQLTVDELGGTMTVAARKEEHRALPTTRYGMPWDERVVAIRPADAIAPTRAVLETLLSGGEYPSGEDGRLAVAVLVAAYVSNENGHQSVAVDDGLPRERVFPWA